MLLGSGWDTSRIPSLSPSQYFPYVSICPRCSDRRHRNPCTWCACMACADCARLIADGHIVPREVIQPDPTHIPPRSQPDPTHIPPRSQPDPTHIPPRSQPDADPGQIPARSQPDPNQIPTKPNASPIPTPIPIPISIHTDSTRSLLSAIPLLSTPQRDPAPLHSSGDPLPTTSAAVPTRPLRPSVDHRFRGIRRGIGIQRGIIGAWRGIRCGM